ncbi:MAG TPA: hypothetical protein VGE38_04965 [Nocardioides sp.]|uniref:hypothetical protein n=1 Tax=Nocardioides sp. TaxID=35761 RepID=UPI002EDA5CE7
MASEDSERKQAPSLQAPSLRAPSLRLGRKRRPTDGTAAAAPVDVPADVPASSPAPKVERAPKPPRTPKAQKAPRPPKPRRQPRQPLNAHLAAALAGLLVAVALVGGTAGSLRACEAVGGSDTCGGPGFLLLVGILAVAVSLGALVLRWLGVPSGGTVSFLAVALVAVVTTTFLLDSLDSVVTTAVVAVLTVLAFVLARWVTARYIDAVA